MKWLMIVLTVAATWTFVQGKDECPQNTVYKFYSDARLSEETGDVLGDELALKPTAGDFYDALLYLYEGAPNTDGIALSGVLQGGILSLEGDWIEDLIEYPSKRHISRTQHVRLKGQMSKSRFRGSMQIGDESSPVSLRLVTHIWLCKPQTDQRPTTTNQ
jgi:hypothetical protein